VVGVLQNLHDDGWIVAGRAVDARDARKPRTVGIGTVFTEEIPSVTGLASEGICTRLLRVARRPGDSRPLPTSR
jgi:hypothetical protein